MRVAFEREGRAEQFNRLKHFLPGHDDGAPYADVAREIGASEGALKVAVHRFRRRYRDLFHAEVSQLVADPSDVDAEIKYILNALRA